MESRKAFWAVLALLCLTFDNLSGSPLTDEIVVNVRHITRLRRSATDGVEVIFPTRISFALDFSNGRTESLMVTKQPHMNENFKLTDEDGPITHDYHKYISVYQNARNHTNVIVDCSHVVCTLQGSLHLDGKQMRISPVVPGETAHMLKEKVVGDDGMVFGNDGVIPPGMANPRNNTGASKPEVRKKRYTDSISGCNVFECIAVVDHTVWNFWVAKVGAASAEAELTKYFLEIYTEADARFQFFQQLSASSCNQCIRVYLVEIVIQKDAASAWTAIYGAGPFDGNDGLYECSKVRVAKLQSVQHDHMECYTKLDMSFKDSVSLYHRGVSFVFVACDPLWEATYAVSVIESKGDIMDLVLAHELSHSIGADHDSLRGCDDGDKYIMSEFGSLANHPSSYYNNWWHSVCSVADICAYLTKLGGNNCLKVNTHVSQATFSTFIADNLPGQELSFNDHCELTYGIGSYYCGNVEFPENMCETGILCFVDGACVDTKTRVYQGTPCGPASVCMLSRCTPIPNVPIDGICIMSSQCADPNSLCDTTVGLCKCKSGFFNQGGTCVPLVSLSSGCTTSSQCADPNAECDVGLNVCVCKPGFSESSQTCIANLGDIADTCSTCSGQCTVPGSECNSGVCSCPPGTKLVSAACWGSSVGDVCSATPVDTCSPPNVVCGSRGRCECSGIQVRGVCYDGTFGDSCSTTEAGTCQEPNTVCIAGNCGCISGFTRVNDVCVEGKIGDTCTTSPNTCSLPNSECDGSACICSAGFTFVDGGCYATGLGSSPCVFTSCSGSGVTCNGGTCVCDCGYSEVSGVCLQGNHGDACNASPDSCTAPNTVCTSGTCQCASGYSWSGSACVGTALGSTGCTATSCGANLRCVNNRCVCNAGLTEISGSCVAGTFNQACNNNPDSCTEENTVCTASKCQCAPNTVRSNGVCAVYLGEVCSAGTDTCFGANTVCTADADTCQNTCQCASGYYNNADPAVCGGTCVSQVALGGSCDPTLVGVCENPDRVECEAGQFICVCKPGYVQVSTDCVASVLAVGDPCTCNDVCSPPETTECNAGTGQCACKTGFTNNNGVCESGGAIPLGGECQSAVSCAGYPTTKCSGSGPTKTCQCNKGYTESGGVCV